MTRRATITRSDHFARLIDELVASGRYGSAEEVIADGLRLIEERERRVQRLNAAIDEGLASGVAEDFSWEAVRRRAARIEGEESGAPQPFDSDAFLARMHEKHAGKF